MPKIIKTVFISYRRQDVGWAELVFQSLKGPAGSPPGGLVPPLEVQRGPRQKCRNVADAPMQN